MLIATWPDGSRTTGADATEVLKKLRRGQVWQHRRWETPAGFREEMQRRAIIWTDGDVIPDLNATDEKFLASLVEAGLVKVTNK